MARISTADGQVPKDKFEEELALLKGNGSPIGQALYGAAKLYDNDKELADAKALETKWYFYLQR